MLAGVPLAFAIDLDHGAVDQEVQRALRPAVAKQPVFEEAEEGPGRRQPGVLRAGRAAARGFEIVQKRQNGGYPQMVETEARWLDPVSFGSEPHQKLEAESFFCRFTNGFT